VLFTKVLQTYLMGLKSDFLGGNFQFSEGFRMAARFVRRRFPRVRKLAETPDPIFWPFLRDPLMLSKIVSTMVSPTLWREAL